VAETRARAFPRYLRAAFALLAADTPAHFAALRDTLGALAIVIRLGDEQPLRVCIADGAPSITEASQGEVALQLGEPAFDALLHGELTVEEAIAADRLAVKGKLDEVLIFLDALHIWLHGALRCPALHDLYARYLTDTR
jgi:hypothetical protein